MQKGGLFCSLVLLNKVSKEHSYPFLTDSIIEVSGADVKLALDARRLCVFLSEAPPRKVVMGCPSR